MKIVKAGYEILEPFNPALILRSIEIAARTCYKSEDKMDDDGISATLLVASLIDKGHEAMLEHQSITVRFICDRGISHEIVRHRLASYAQESTRYCDYSKGKFGNGITVIAPYFWDDLGIYHSQYNMWYEACLQAEKMYLGLIERGATPQQARTVLPNSLKTEVVMTANLREWRHFLKLRTAKAAHPQMQEVARPLCARLAKDLPVIFAQIYRDMDRA